MGFSLRNTQNISSQVDLPFSGVSLLDVFS
jgi:hypothetical protein